MLKVLGYVDVSLTLSRVNAMEELRAGEGDWVCSVALLILGTVASWGFEMEAKSDRDGSRAWNKGCKRAVSFCYIWVEAVTRP